MSLRPSPRELVAAFKASQRAIKSKKRELCALVGAKVRSLRKAVGLNQTDLGDLAGLTRTSMTNLEAGRQNIGLVVLLRLANGLGVNPGDLLPTQDEIREVTG